jgi:hypothetical protein
MQEKQIWSELIFCDLHMMKIKRSTLILWKEQFLVMFYFLLNYEVIYCEKNGG